MTLKSYITSGTGRIGIGTLGFALIAAGLLLCIGSKDFALIGLPVACIFVAVGYIVAVGSAIHDHPRIAAVMVIALPFVGGVYFTALRVLIPEGLGGLGAGLIVLGYLLGWLSLRGYRFLDPALRKQLQEEEAAEDAPPAGDAAHSHH